MSSIDQLEPRENQDSSLDTSVIAPDLLSLDETDHWNNPQTDRNHDDDFDFGDFGTAVSGGAAAAAATVGMQDNHDDDDDDGFGDFGKAPIMTGSGDVDADDDFGDFGQVQAVDNHGDDDDFGDFNDFAQGGGGGGGDDDDAFQGSGDFGDFEGAKDDGGDAFGTFESAAVDTPIAKVEEAPPSVEASFSFLQKKGGDERERANYKTLLITRFHAGVLLTKSS